jgi:transcription termination/antitermination protein NusG
MTEKEQEQTQKANEQQETSETDNISNKITEEIKDNINTLNKDTKMQEELEEEIEIEKEEIKQAEDDLKNSTKNEEQEATEEPSDFDIKKPDLNDYTEEEDINTKLNQVNKEIKNENKDIENDDRIINEIDNEINEESKIIDEFQKNESNEEDKKEETVKENEDVSTEEDKKEETVKEDVSEKDESEAFIEELNEFKDETVSTEEDKKEETVKEDVSEKDESKSSNEKNEEDKKELTTNIYALRTTANREDQVMDFLTSHAKKKKFDVYSVIKAHGMRGYIFIEAKTKSDAEQAAFGVPYARGILPKEIEYSEIEHMLEQVKKEVNIQQNDIVEIISGPFKRENAKIIRIDKGKEEVVVELLEAAVPIPITLKLDSVKVIRRENNDEESE